MNRIHGRFEISNEDFLYVLSSFVFEPIRWNARFGWRRMIEKERRALFHFWRAVGERMDIKNIPEDYAAFEKFSVEYERAHYRFSEANQRVGLATRELFKSWFPRPLRPLVERGIHGFMDDQLIEAFGFPKPSPAMRRTVAAGLKLRAHFLRIWPRRRRPLLRTEMTHASYPNGYRIETVGPADSPAAQSHCPNKS